METECIDGCDLGLELISHPSLSLTKQDVFYSLLHMH
jgi:hypothetical protein